MCNLCRTGVSNSASAVPRVQPFQIVYFSLWTLASPMSFIFATPQSSAFRSAGDPGNARADVVTQLRQEFHRVRIHRRPRPAIFTSDGKVPSSAGPFAAPSAARTPPPPTTAAPTIKPAALPINPATTQAFVIPSPMPSIRAIRQRQPRPHPIIPVRRPRHKSVSVTIRPPPMRCHPERSEGVSDVKPTTYSPLVQPSQPPSNPPLPTPPPTPNWDGDSHVNFYKILAPARRHRPAFRRSDLPSRAQDPSPPPSPQAPARQARCNPPSPRNPRPNRTPRNQNPLRIQRRLPQRSPHPRPHQQRTRRTPVLPPQFQFQSRLRKNRHPASPHHATKAAAPPTSSPAPSPTSPIPSSPIPPPIRTSASNPSASSASNPADILEYRVITTTTHPPFAPQFLARPQFRSHRRRHREISTRPAGASTCSRRAVLSRRTCQFISDRW